MRTSLKAALAGVAGVGLLLGGAGSLAFWDDEETVDGGTIKAGTLNLRDPDCGVGWTLGGAAVTPLDSTTYRIVPGTTLIKTCDFQLSVVGDVNAKMTVDDQAVDKSTLGGELDVTTEYELRNQSLPVVPAVTIDESTPWSFTEADTGKTLRATITVTLPWDGDAVADGDQVDNTSNSLVGDADNVALAAALEDLTVTVTQTS